MNIQFTIKNEQILLRADAMNYELCRIAQQTNIATGEVVDKWKPFKYFTSLDQALSRIIDLKVRASDARSLAELKTVVEAARDEVCRTWKTDLERAR